MDEIVDNFAWVHQLECPPTIYNNSVKKILCKGVLELLWEEISISAFSTAKSCKIRKNILLYKLRHGIDDSAISSLRHLNQLRAKSNVLKRQISAVEEKYEEQDYIVRQKMQRLKDIKSRCSITSVKKDFLKLKYSETTKQLKDCGDMRLVCQHLKPNICKDIDQQRLREHLNIVADLRHSIADKKQIWTKISSFLGNIEIQILWTHLYQALSQDLDALMELENKSDNLDSLNVVGENIDIGIARTCGQYICMILKRISSNTNIEIYQQRLLEFIQNIESLSSKDVSAWLVLKLEVIKLEVQQKHLLKEVQILKNIIQENFLLNFDVARLINDIENIDAQMEKYIKDIQQSIAVLNSTPMLVFKEKEKLLFELQKIIALKAENYNKTYMNNALDIELDMFYNILDLNALRKVMLKGNIGLYRHVSYGLDKVTISAINSRYSKIKPHFPIIQIPVYSLIECYKNTIANIIYTKLHDSLLAEKIECIDKLIPSREKANYNNLELFNLTTVVCDQANEEIKRFNACLSAWTNQDVQEAMALDETTVDGMSFEKWLQCYKRLLYMIRNSK